MARGDREFVLDRVADGQMLDRERLAAAKYAAGLQSQVELAAEDSSTGVADSELRPEGTSASVGAR